MSIIHLCRFDLRWLKKVFMLTILLSISATSIAMHPCCGNTTNSDSESLQEEFLVPITQPAIVGVPPLRQRAIVAQVSQRLIFPHRQRVFRLPRARYFIDADTRAQDPNCSRYSFRNLHGQLGGQVAIAPPCAPGLGSLSNAFSMPGISGELTASGILTFDVRSYRSNLSGRELFNRMLSYLGINNIVSIEARWNDVEGLEDKYRSYRRYRDQGLSPTEAAANTFTGRMALRAGYSDVNVIQDNGVYGIRVEFAWPDMSYYPISSALDQTPPDNCRGNNNFGGFNFDGCGPGPSEFEDDDSFGEGGIVF